MTNSPDSPSESPFSPDEQAFSPGLPRVIVLGTGGTISCERDARGDLVPAVSTAELLRRAGIAERSDVALEGHDVMQLDSSSLSLADSDALLGHIDRARRGPNVRGVVVLHGTDTMEESAGMAELLLPNGDPTVAGVPVVFTGAQLPADAPHPDGFGNIRDSVELLASGAGSPVAGSAGAGASGAGTRVRICFGGRTLPALGAYKHHTSSLDAFRSVFSSDADLTGALDGLTFNSHATQLPRLEGLRVPIVSTYAGDGGEVIRALLAGERLDGVVVVGLGSGNLPLPVAAVVAELARDIPVCIATRVDAGEVSLVYGGAGGGAEMGRRGAVGAGSLRPSQARLRLLAEAAWARQHLTGA